MRNEDGKTPLHLVAGSLSTNGTGAQALIEAGGYVNARDDKGNTPLHESVAKPNVGVFMVLLDAKANVNMVDDLGFSPLHVVVDAQSGSLTARRIIMEQLTKAGADLDVKDEQGRTALHIAAGRDVVKIETLLDAGASPNPQSNKGETPLHIAAKAGVMEIIRALIEAGADTSIVDDGGNTPLDVVCSCKACPAASICADDVERLIKALQ